VTPPRSRPVRLGVAYYPEQWPEERWPVDARLMVEAGIRFVRMAEFSWSKLEPQRGVLDFGWLDRALSLMAANDLDVVLGTPTAAPPVSLIAEHPDILPVDRDGRVFPFGHRRHYCPTNATYREETRRIVAALAARYGADARISAWQIDNELGGRCYCPRCEAAFRTWLEERYGSLDELNASWGTAFWSQTYGSWEEIGVPPAGNVPLPEGFMRASPSPAHALDYHRFSSDSFVQYQQLQIDVIRRHSDLPITHNMMGFGFDEIDYQQLARNLDFLSWDNYPLLGRSGGWIDPALGCDAIRGLKDVPFWVMEQQVGPLGWETIRTPRRGQMRLHTFQMVAHGAEAISYFRWRSARFGTEQHWYGVLDHDGRPNRRLRELAELARELRGIDDLLAETEPDTQAGVVYDYDARFALEVQPTNPALAHVDAVRAHYGALRRQGVDVDLLAPTADLSRYRLVIAPSLYLVDEALAGRLRAYVEGGGLLVLGPRSAFKDRTNAVPERALPAWLDELAGLEVSDIASFLDGRPTALEPVEGMSPNAVFRGWFEELSLKGARPLYRYRDHDFAGSAAIAIDEFGSGRVVYIGGVATDETLVDLYTWLAREAQLDTFVAPADVEVVRLRKADGSKLLFLLNYSDYERVISVSGERASHLDGTLDGGSLVLEPYGVALLEAQRPSVTLSAEPVAS
jgi:beta-galactosidase